MNDTATKPETTDQKFLVAANGRFGSGVTLDEAKRNFTKFGGQLSKGYIIYEFDSETIFTGVSKDGYWHAHGLTPDSQGNPPTETQVPARKRR